MELRQQSKWLAYKIARDTGVSETQAESGILELIAKGHLRVIPCVDPEGLDAFEPIIKGRQT